MCTHTWQLLRDDRSWRCILCDEVSPTPQYGGAPQPAPAGVVAPAEVVADVRPTAGVPAPGP